MKFGLLSKTAFRYNDKLVVTIQQQQQQHVLIRRLLFGTHPTPIRHGSAPAATTTATKTNRGRRFYSRQRDGAYPSTTTTSSSSFQIQDDDNREEEWTMDGTTTTSTTNHSKKNKMMMMKKKKRKKILFQSLGCPRNFVDTEVMLGLSIRDGNMDVTYDLDDANVVVINTCGFLESAREESRRAIQTMADNKPKDCKLIVTGCMVNLLKQQQQQQQSQKQQKSNGTGITIHKNKATGRHQGGEIEFLQNFPQIDAMISAGEIDQVVERIEALDVQSGDRDDGRNKKKKRMKKKKTTTSSSITTTTTTTGRRIQDDEEDGTVQQQRDGAVPPPGLLHTQRSSRRSFLEKGDTPRFLATPPHYAYLKIAEGCRKRCSFCVIPTIKGRLQSKPIHQVVDEFKAIRQHGTANEVILIAQDLGDYGKDWKRNMSRDGRQEEDQQRQQRQRQHRDLDDTHQTTNDVAIEDGNSGSSPNQHQLQKSHLTLLLEALLASMDEDEDDVDTDDNNNNNNNQDDERYRFWLRLLYLYPDEVTPDLIDVMARDTRIARYVDLPIQHSHDDILKSMRRTTSSDDIRNTITLLRQRLPDVYIRTSLMVGFPGETEEHFQHLLDFVREVQLDHIGVFIYSDEELAYSSKLPNHVPDDIKQDRYDRLMATQWTVVEKRHQERVAQRERLMVVIEGLKENDDDHDNDDDDNDDTDRSTVIVGRHVGQCPDIDGQVLLEGQPRVFAGERYWVEVTGYDGHDLIGRVLPEEEEEQEIILDRTEIDVVSS